LPEVEAASMPPLLFLAAALTSDLINGLLPESRTGGAVTRAELW